MAVVATGGSARSSLAGRPTVLSSAAETGLRSVRALPLVEAALRDGRIQREEVECVAVGLGPGSYTGIRIAIALAQGWQLAREVKLLGVSSAHCLAAAAQEMGRRGRIHVAIDAQRNEVYLAEYELGDIGWTEISPLRLAAMTEVQALAAGGATVVGPEVDRWCQTGALLFPSARQLGLLAAACTEFVPGETLAPICLRPVTFVKAPPPRVVRVQRADS